MAKLTIIKPRNANKQKVIYSIMVLYKQYVLHLPLIKCTIKGISLLYTLKNVQNILSKIFPREWLFNDATLGLEWIL